MHLRAVHRERKSRGGPGRERPATSPVCAGSVIGFLKPRLPGSLVREGAEVDLAQEAARSGGAACRN